MILLSGIDGLLGSRREQPFGHLLVVVIPVVSIGVVVWHTIGLRFGGGGGGALCWLRGGRAADDVQVERAVSLHPSFVR